MLSRRLTQLSRSHIRCFATSELAGAQDSYVPTKNVNLATAFTIFNNTDLSRSNIIQQAPWEIKSTTFNNVVGITACSLVGSVSSVALTFYGSSFFFANWFYQVYKYMSRAVVKLDLQPCGTKVEATLKMGGTQTWNIADVYKSKNEKVLVETFAEPFMFPIEVQGAGKFFILGAGHEAIKDGELFRAVINGKNISTE